MDTLRLDNVDVSNYRCFAQCEINLDPKLTVFVAENGQGKTAILDAISMALGPVVDELSGVKQWAGIEGADVRQVPSDDGMCPSLPTELSARGVIDGARVNWSVVRKNAGPRGRTATKQLAGLQRAASAMRARLDGFADRKRQLPPPLPLVAYYGTGRLWAEHRLTKGRKRRDPTPLGRLSGYKDCLSSASSFKSFAAWYGDVQGAARSPTLVAADPTEHPVQQLSAVREATHVVMAPTGWKVLDWEWELPLKEPDGRYRSAGHLVVEHPVHGRLPLSRLSDGVRNMIALVADVAHRCVLLNPQFGLEASRRTPGVLLVDEIDMHLHPGWQQEVIGLLQQAFPLVQLIVTTHSPQVLSTVERESIRVIAVRDGVGTLDLPQHQTRGVESADVLARVMGVHTVPRVEQARWLTEYRVLVQTGQDESDKAKALWNQLLDHFGERHPVMDDIATLRRLQDFKRAHGIASGRT